MQAWQDYLKYLAQFATPIIVGKTVPGVLDRPDPTTGLTIRAVDALLEQLLKLHNSSAIAVQGGAEIELLFSTGEGKAFLNAIALFNEEITKAITTQTLATNEGQHQARAAASVHQDALDTLIRQAKRSICHTLRRDVLRNLIRYNFGDAAVLLTPKISLGELQVEDAASMITAFSHVGFAIHPSQMAGIDRRLNLPARTLTPEEQMMPQTAPMPVPNPPAQPPQPAKATP